MFCKHCGAENPDGTNFCSKCGQPLDATQPAQPVQPVPQVVVVQQPAVKPARNVGALVCAIIAAIFGILAGIIWTSCFATAGKILADAGIPSAKAGLYAFLYALFGIGGGVLTIIGGVQAFHFQKRLVAIILSFGGFAFQLACLITTIALFGSAFIVVLVIAIWTIISLILSLVASCLSLKKDPNITQE